MPVYTLDDRDFGTVKIILRAGMKNVFAKVRNGQLCVSFPLVASKASILQFLDTNRDALRQFVAVNTPKQPLFHDGQTIHCLGFDVVITSNRNHAPQNLTDITIVVPANFNFDSAENTKRISQAVRQKVAQHKPYLVDYAWQVAKEKGLQPKRIVACNGFRRLGRCIPSTGEINLSYALLFLPEHLVRYVICHELAHLKHPNHSPQFHALCNKLVDGTEKQCTAELNHFPWPVLR
ncbi:MAG: M48 family metallopeptidase [Muribaculaceae bacterium]